MSLSQKRVTIFIDGSNLYHGIKNDLKRYDLNYQAFANVLCGERELIRVHYYNAPIDQETDPEKYKKQQKFFENIRNLDYFRVILGRLEPRENTFVEKGIDIHIAVDMLTLAYKNAYDVAILVSGDADFAKAVEAVQDLGKHVENATTKSTSSNRLAQTCDKIIRIDHKLLENCWLNHKK